MLRGVGEVPGVGARLAALWRSIWTPPAVRAIEDAAPEAGAGLPGPAPGRPPYAGLPEMRDRLERIERRNRELARLYARWRAGEEEDEP